jgi:hypothetical protein
MKKLFSFAMLFCLAPLLGGCFLLPPQRYDGSESFSEAHPEYQTAPDYMQPGDRHADGN